MRPLGLLLLNVILLFSSLSPFANAAGRPVAAGEKISYAIKKYGVKAGEATLLFHGPVTHEGREYQLIVFTASALNFFDEERIYADPETLFPVRVERDLDIWGTKERIIEEYDRQRGVVRIAKLAGGKTTEQTIEKDGRLDNIYCFIYRYRHQGRLGIGETVTMNLPTQDVVIQLTGKSRIKAGGRVHEALFMKSQPAKYRIWFENGSRKIPLRIDGAVGFGNTSMVMTDYQTPE